MSKKTICMPAGAILTLFLLCLCLQGCSQVRSKTTFPDTGLIEKELKRGVSSEADVEKILGKAKGYGEAVLPPDHKHHTVRYYEKFGIQTSRDGQEITLHVEQGILLVFFIEGIYDGHMWYSGVGTGSMRRARD